MPAFAIAVGLCARTFPSGIGARLLAPFELVKQLEFWTDSFESVRESFEIVGELQVAT